MELIITIDSALPLLEIIPKKKNHECTKWFSYKDVYHAEFLRDLK